MREGNTGSTPSCAASQKTPQRAFHGMAVVSGGCEGGGVLRHPQQKKCAIRCWNVTVRVLCNAQAEKAKFEAILVQELVVPPERGSVSSCRSMKRLAYLRVLKKISAEQS